VNKRRLDNHMKKMLREREDALYSVSRLKGRLVEAVKEVLGGDEELAQVMATLGMLGKGPVSNIAFVTSDQLRSHTESASAAVRNMEQKFLGYESASSYGTDSDEDGVRVQDAVGMSDDQRTEAEARAIMKQRALMAGKIASKGGLAGTMPDHVRPLGELVGKDVIRRPAGGITADAAAGARDGKKSVFPASNPYDELDAYLKHNPDPIKTGLAVNKATSALLSLKGKGKGKGRRKKSSSHARGSRASDVAVDVSGGVVGGESGIADTGALVLGPAGTTVPSAVLYDSQHGRLSSSELPVSAAPTDALRALGLQVEGSSGINLKDGVVSATALRQGVGTARAREILERATGARGGGKGRATPSVPATPPSVPALDLSRSRASLPGHVSDGEPGK
jgi:hypothetical protein